MIVWYLSSIVADPRCLELAAAAPVCTAGGKPSTWFPPGRLVELYLLLFLVAVVSFVIIGLAVTLMMVMIAKIVKLVMVEHAGISYMSYLSYIKY